MASSSLRKYILDRVIFVLLGTMLFMGYSHFRLSQYYAMTDYSAFALTTSSVHLNCTYDVFTSFHGADVRRGFLSHLLKEFKGEAIDTFIDSNIERGKSIGPRFIKSIRGSSIAIVVLSRNYASSTWCLNELAEIMNCRKELGLIVMVVFYEVDPADVKKLTGYFGRVFRKTCAGKRKADILRWRLALAKVATIAGYHSTNWDNEAAMIEQIANDVSNKLNNSTGPSK